MSDDRLRDATSRAVWAKELLQNEMLKEAFDTLQESYLRLWKFTDPSDSAGREKIFIAWHVVGKVQDHLRSFIDSGKLAQMELDELIATQERKKRFSFRN